MLDLNLYINLGMNKNESIIFCIDFCVREFVVVLSIRLNTFLLNHYQKQRKRSCPEIPTFRSIVNYSPFLTTEL